MTEQPAGRRPLTSRDSGWAKALAARLAAWKVAPNAISLLSVVVAGGACASMLLSTDAGRVRPALLVAAAVCVQLRLLCNLLDGMVAVEWGLKTKTGELFNDIPDRIADPLILVPVGYMLPWAWGPAAGWLAGLLAVATAYVRVLGGSVGLKQDFSGPMAKPHRMATITVALLLEAALSFAGKRDLVLAVALGVVIAGSLFTVARRTVRIARGMEAR